LVVRNDEANNPIVEMLRADFEAHTLTILEQKPLEPAMSKLR
jgi:hypothetical protein